MRNFEAISWTRRSLRIGLACALAFFGFQFLQYHYKIITHPFPLEFREGALLVSTDQLLKGENPFSLKNQPRDTNVYGILYPLTVYPVAKIFGATALVHRVVAAIFIPLSCLLIYLFLRRDEVSHLLSISAAVLFYPLLIFPNTSTANIGPHSLGAFLFLLTVFVGFYFQYSTISLIFSLILGIMAFYSKTYYVLGIPYLALFLFLFVSKKKSLFYSFSFLVLFCVSIWFVHMNYETYFSNCFFAHVTASGSNKSHLYKQLLEFVRIHREIFLGLAFISILGISSMFKSIKLFVVEGKHVFDWRHMSKPLLCMNGNLALFCLLISLILVWLKLGIHTGSWMAYLFQLMSPFLLIFAFHVFSKKAKMSLMIIPLIILNLFFLSRNFNVSLDDNSEGWHKLENLVSSHERIFNSPAETIFLVEQNKPIVDSGHSNAFKFGISRLSIFQHFFKPDFRVMKRHLQYADELKKAVLRKEFDLILAAKNWAPMLPGEVMNTYRPIDVIPISMPHSRQKWDITVWVPKN